MAGPTKLVNIYQVPKETVIWQEKGTTNLFDLDLDAMRKGEVGMRSTRVYPGRPIPTQTKDDVLLYNSGWQDDGESYILMSRHYLIPHKK